MVGRGEVGGGGGGGKGGLSGEREGGGRGRGDNLIRALVHQQYKI